MNPYQRWGLIALFSPIIVVLLAISVLFLALVALVCVIEDVGGAVLDNKPINWKNLREFRRTL